MQVLVLEKKKEKNSGTWFCGLGLISAQLSGQGGEATVAGWRDRPDALLAGACSLLMALLGRGLALGSAQSARKRGAGAVHSRLRSTAGAGGPSARSRWTRTTLSFFLRFAVHQVQLGLPLHLQTVADRGALRRGRDQPWRRAVVPCPRRFRVPLLVRSARTARSRVWRTRLLGFGILQRCS